jgi:hypothetical protein
VILGVSVFGGLVLVSFKESPGELSQVELKRIVIEFLNITDVADGRWDGTVEVEEVYDHKLGSKVMVVNFNTINAVHIRATSRPSRQGIP